jgi:hypothetical protein
MSAQNCYFGCLCNSLSDLICDVSYQWIEFTTTHCFTKLVENRTLATMISADMLLNPLPYYLIFHLRKTLFPLVSSRTKNLLEICSPVDFMVDLEGRRTTRNRIPTFVTANFTGFLPHVQQKKGIFCITLYFISANNHLFCSTQLNKLA